MTYYARVRRRRRILCLFAAALLVFIIGIIVFNRPSGTSFERDMIALINEERKSAGLEPLKTDSAARRVAEKKAQELYEQNYFAHESPIYGDLASQMEAHSDLVLGRDIQGAGENIARAFGYPEDDLTANFFHKVFMESPDHRDNVLYEDYTHCGVAMYIAPGGNAYVAQEFIIIKSKNGQYILDGENQTAMPSVDISSYDYLE